jgi:hypothetical protein
MPTALSLRRSARWPRALSWATPPWSLRVAQAPVRSPWIPQRRTTGSVRRNVVAIEVGVEEVQAELHGGPHGDSRFGGFKP